MSSNYTKFVPGRFEDALLKTGVGFVGVMICFLRAYSEFVWSAFNRTRRSEHKRSGFGEKNQFNERASNIFCSSTVTLLQAY